MTTPIINAMNNVDFLDFVQSRDASGRLQKACEDFFTDYHGQDPETQLNTIPRRHLVALWRFFVAYTLGLPPYGFQMDLAFQNGYQAPWETEGLKKLITEQHESTINQSSNQAA
ncbi:hypothetical protein [Marinomonas sp.]